MDTNGFQEVANGEAGSTSAVTAASSEIESSHINGSVHVNGSSASQPSIEKSDNFVEEAPSANNSANVSNGDQQTDIETQLAKQALGVGGDGKLLVKQPVSEAPKEETNFSRYENLLDDEFDECFDEKPRSGAIHEEPVQTPPLNESEPPTVPPAQPKKDAPQIISKDINEINRIWREKQQKLLSSEISDRPRLEPAIRNMPKQKSLTENESALKQQPLPSYKLPFQASSPVADIISQSNRDSGPPNSVMSTNLSLGLQNTNSVTNAEITTTSLTNSSRERELEDLRMMASKDTTAPSDSADGDAISSDKADQEQKYSIKMEDGSVVTSDIDFQPVQLSSQQPRNCSLEDILKLFEDNKDSSANIQSTVQLSGWKGLRRAFFGPPKLSRGLQEERDSIFYLAKTQFEDSNPTHVSMIKTLYRKLTQTSEDCARYGKHWQDIGFQGLDPTTDFRACGMLGLFHLTFLVLTNQPLALQVYRTSLHDTANFPLCVLSINLTKSCLQVLREEKLNKLANSEKSIITPFNDLFIAMVDMFHERWKALDKTIGEMGFVLKDIEDRARNNTRSFILNCRQKKTNSNSAITTTSLPILQEGSPQSKQPEEEKLEGFVGIEQLE